MADPITYPRFVLAMTSPWNLANETTHTWHCKFSVSPTAQMNFADAEATALDLFKPIAEFTAVTTDLYGWTYYPAGSKLSAAGTTYPQGTHKGTALGLATANAANAPGECCLVVRNHCGTNTRGKPVYLRKWIHNTFHLLNDPNTIGNLQHEPVSLQTWNTASGPHAVVPVDPTGGARGDGWHVEQHVYTRQFRRGPRRKPAAAAGGLTSDVINAVEKALQAKGLASLLETLAGAAG
jgi:hypothetical protein